VDSSELDYMKKAVEMARKCQSELGKTSPLVGAVVVKDGKELIATHRGAKRPGDHAEYIALEIELKDVPLAGATVYTTLEPCTVRNPPKTPCAERLVARKVSRVVIGMLDPNPSIRGEGMLTLRRANIAVDLFPPDLMSELEDLNREFIRAQRPTDRRGPVEPAFVEKNQARALDEWYRVLNHIYWNKNYDRDRMAILAHLTETIGSLSLLASSKKKPGIDPESYVAKSIAWWLALCGKLGVKSVSDLLWDKFPGVCSYCHKSPHDPDECSERKHANPGPQWETLGEIGKKNEKPKSIGDWQLMFSTIYPAQQTEDYGPSFGRLTEEMGELAEAVRVFPSHPGYFLSEAADVFAWLMHIQNIIEQKKGIKKTDRGKAIGIAFCKSYPDDCRDCGGAVCVCPPILASTVGRIGHEVPPVKGSYGQHGRFMTADKASEFFQKTS
jgi:pyrimidine deaminase RibD-like protein